MDLVRVGLETYTSTKGISDNSDVSIGCTAANMRHHTPGFLQVWMLKVVTTETVRINTCGTIHIRGM